ncbi:MAG: RecB-like helicase [Helicobacteraceae bacterium]|nr:RecB-like helicase [Helicobacteraceae bacterium]
MYKDFPHFLAYEASAGSGKTFNLVVRYLALLFMGVEAKKILTLTFTNKASNEMQERIVKTLKTLDSRDELAVIAKLCNIKESELLEKRADVLEKFLSSETKIMTIDKFFALILRKFSLHLGLMPNFNTYESQHKIKLLSRFLNEVMIANKEESLINLTLMAKERVSDIFSLLDELYLKQHEMSGFVYESRDYINFENSAMSELNSLSTMVHAHKASSTTAKNGVIAKDFKELSAKSWISKESLNYRTFTKCYSIEMDQHLHAIQGFMEQAFKAKEQSFFYEVSSLLSIYEKSKMAIAKSDNELGFDDITNLTYTLLNKMEDSEFLYFRLDATIDHILLDEFQDTSIIQFDVLAPLVTEIHSGEGVKKDGSFFFVGDVKQSIYRFRGGVSELFGEVAHSYDVKVEPLVTNYRSQRAVVEFVNDVFRDKIANYKDQVVKPKAKSGYVEVISSDEPLESTLKTVRKLIELGSPLEQIAILCATNADGARVEHILKEAGILVVTETTSKLLAQRNIVAIIEYFKYCYFEEQIYKENFFAILEREVTDLAKFNVNTNTLLSATKYVIEKYELFSGDINYLRFLNTITSFKDIEQFLYESDRDSTASAQLELKGVRVLTIHKSKGLEFKNVIVMDRTTRPKPRNEMLIYDYDGIKLKNIYLRQKGRDTLDRAYEEALNKEKELVEIDNLNALYVAFTRAENSLFVIQKSKESQFKLLGLTHSSRGELVIEKEEAILHSTPNKLEYEAISYGVQSEIIKTTNEDEKDLSAIEFGLALHYTLEMMSLFTLQALHSALKSTQNRFGSFLDEKSFNDLFTRTSLLIENKEFQNFVSSGKIYKERAFTINKELRYIDLMIEKDENIVIIDYKSSKNFHDKNLAQVSFYKSSVEHITGKKVSAYLCYILSSSVKLVEV